MANAFDRIQRSAGCRLVARCLSGLLLGCALTSHAQTIPAELDRACPDAFSADPLAWVVPDVGAPAHRFDVTLDAEGSPSQPYRFTVWRTPCPGDASRTRAWLRVSDPTGAYRNFLRLPLITVEQSGRTIGSFATRTTYRRNGAFQDYFALVPEENPAGSLGSSGAISGALINTNPAVAFDPAAPFTLRVRRNDTTGAAATVRVDVPDARMPGNIGFMPSRIAGHWWTPSRPGSGLVLARNERETLYAAWMTYDDTGRATWYVMVEGLPTGDGSIAGKVYSPRGPAYPAPHLNSAQRVELGPQVGTFSFRFKDDSHAEFAWSVLGTQHVQAIEKLNIAHTPTEPLYTCDTHTGVWLSNLVSGWGIGITGSPSLAGCRMHTALLTYDTAGIPTWYFAALADDGRSSTVYTFLTNLPRALPIKSGAIYQPTGTPYRDVTAAARVELGEPVGLLESVMVTTSATQFRYVIRGVPLNLDLQNFRFEY